MTTPLATACGLAALASVVAALFPRYRASLLWFAALALGQGAGLSLIVAGPQTRYQHYLPFGTIVQEHPWLLATLVTAALAAAAGLFRMARARGWASSHLWRMAIALALSVVTAATVSPDVRRYVAELAFAAALQLVAVCTVALAVLSWPAGAEQKTESAVNRVLGPDDGAAARGRTFPWVAAATAIVFSAAINLVAYERHPHIPDEVVYLHQAKYLAQGQLTLPPAPVPAAFEIDLMEYEPARWFSPVPPGWPFVLALGAFAGVPWLVNPLLAGLNVLLAYGLLRSLYSVRLARAAALLLAVSPWFLFLGMSFMTHQLTLTGSLMGAVGVQRARESGRWWWGLVAGAGLGIASLVRPLDGVIVGALIGLWAIGLGGSRLRFGALAGLAIGTVAIGSLVLPYNRMLTGSPLKFPINAYVDKHYAPGSNDYGFGAERGLGWPTDPNPGHSPVDAVINANLNAFSLNTDLFGWVTGSLILVAWLLVSGAWRREDSVMLAGVLAFPLAYFPYYFSGGPDFGARYWFPAIVPLAVLTARGLQTLERRMGARVWVAAAAMVVMTAVTYLPWRGVDKYHGYRGMRADIRALAAEHDFGADLVLVSGKRFPDYASAFAENPVDLMSPVAVYAWNRDTESRTAVLKAYADRRVWMIDGPSVTGAGFRIVAGPISARELLAGSSK